MKLKIIFTNIFVIASIFFFSAANAENNYPQISGQKCDGCNPCQGGLACINFPEIGARCAKPDPLSYYRASSNNKCSVYLPMLAQICDDGTSASAVPRVTCQCVGQDCPAVSGGESIISSKGEVIIGGELRDVTIKKDDPERVGGIPGVIGGYSSNENNEEGSQEGGQKIKGNYQPDNIGRIIIDSDQVKFSGKLEMVGSDLIMETAVGKKQINILPKEAISVSHTPNSVESIELKEESRQPVYLIKGKKLGRILFIFPVDLKIETKVSAETGKVLSLKKPWWSFLVNE